jgi:hypothetical protein
MILKNFLKAVSAAALAASALLVGAASATPAFAATTTTYGTWSEVTEVTANQNYTGSVSFGTSGIPDATYETTFPNADTTNEVTLDTNEDEWIPAESPFGAIFGASGPSATVNFLRTDLLNGPQTTVFTFERPVPANRLGIAFGDVDYDTVTVTATDMAGSTMTGAQLIGTSTDNAFNLCADSATMPDSCGAQDASVGTVTTNAFDVVLDNNNSTGGSDGVTAWIYPSAEVNTLTVTHTGFISSIRTWMAVIDSAPRVPEAPVLAKTAAPEAGATLWIALTLGLLGIGGLVAAGRRKVHA